MDSGIDGCVFYGRNGKRKHHQYLYDFNRRQFQRQNKGNESDAQLLCIRSAALSLSDFSSGCCLRKAAHACSGNPGSNLVDGICDDSYGREQKRRKAENRLEFFKKQKVLAPYRSDFLSECSGGQRNRMDGYLF